METTTIKPTFTFEKPIGAYMRVADVLKYLQKNVWCTQYQLITTEGTAIDGNFFKCGDLADMLGERVFRSLECYVNQHWVNV
jgi:hypothetical protein